ncbi:DNA methyltransferase [Kineothrix sp. MB12-C1]|uniref:DNA methyltransferase n=1 Tax=Kineothrix sp. MB12-C1 TaxID=3070215 RepID=UPI0027D1FD88|nr:DNA methyltransferase [Kineothrix sp. MB12-C1]WMC93499.1 DNA methyltransferase [Kineothrix sp. MB12-C1]
MENLLQTLNQINWDFSDYSSTKYPLDLNSIPWYPATFPAPIPKFLIALLTKQGDTVLDPFGGKGTTAVESIKQNRQFIYNDLNPFAFDIANNIFQMMECCGNNRDVITRVYNEDILLLKNKNRTNEVDTYEGKNFEDISKYYPNDFLMRLENLNVNKDVILWYHVDTLIELLDIYEQLLSVTKEQTYFVRKFALVSILKETCSQRGHFTYVTDNCAPKKILYYNAISAYFAMLERIQLAFDDFFKQYYTVNEKNNILSLINKSQIYQGDARKLDWINDASVDLVVTSPPYLCAQDYVKTMRLTNFFFPTEEFKSSVANEIGSRSRRNGNPSIVVNDFYSAMNDVISEVNRVLKSKKYFCLIVGQGKGKITQDYDTVSDLINLIINNHGFEEIFRTSRKISYKVVRVGGVDYEEIIIFRKK